MCRYSVRIIPKRCPDVPGISVRMWPKYAVELICSLYQPLLQITGALADTMMLAGSEAYSGSLIFPPLRKNNLIIRL
ncbi:MAG: hypothetical protein ACM3X9_10690 [Bacillota bacterium]